MAGQSAGHYVIEVMSGTGRHVSIEFRIRRETVELWHRGTCQAVMDRDVFRGWLGTRRATIVVDDVMWTPLDGHQVALVIRAVGWWTITPDFIDALHERL